MKFRQRWASIGPLHRCVTVASLVSALALIVNAVFGFVSVFDAAAEHALIRNNLVLGLIMIIFTTWNFVLGRRDRVSARKD